MQKAQRTNAEERVHERRHAPLAALAKFASQKDHHISAIQRTWETDKAVAYYGRQISSIGRAVSRWIENDYFRDKNELISLRNDILVALYTQIIITQFVKYNIKDKNIILEIVCRQMI